MIKKTILIIILFFIFFPLVNVYADCCRSEDGRTNCDPCLFNPIGEQNTDINTLIGTIINAIMGIVGSLALAMFIYGGFTWMTAAGANEKVQKGKDILIWATVGLIVIFSSYALVYFVLYNVIGGKPPV
jgi:heme/copper-type cytochrome/quinol oxidase subunit 2